MTSFKWTFVIINSLWGANVIGMLLKLLKANVLSSRLFMRAVPMPVNFYKIRKHRSSSPARRACRRAYHHQGHSGAHQPQPRPWQYHRPRGRVQGGEHEVTPGWSVTKTKAELKKLSLSYWNDIDFLIRGLETLDVSSRVYGVRATCLECCLDPGPEEASHTVVYYMMRSEDGIGRLSLVWNVLLMNITRGSR